MYYVIAYCVVRNGCDNKCITYTHIVTYGYQGWHKFQSSFMKQTKEIIKNLRYYSISVFSLLYFVERNIENN